jgi:hypothetical protein
MNVIDKTIINEYIITGILRDSSNIKSPNITIKYNGILPYNYAYIPDFHRYYYISEITSIRTGILDLSLTCDVLMSFKNDIRNSTGIIIESTENGISNYLNNDVWVSMVKDFTDILNFPNGFPDSGEYILITAGGD